MAKVSWCRSSLRLNSTGTMSDVDFGALSLQHFGQAIAVMLVLLRDARMQPLNGRPCEGTSVSSARSA